MVILFLYKSGIYAIVIFFKIFISISFEIFFELRFILLASNVGHVHLILNYLYFDTRNIEQHAHIYKY